VDGIPVNHAMTGDEVWEIAGPLLDWTVAKRPLWAGEPGEAFIEAKPAKRRGLGTGYRQEWYEGLVEQLLERVTLEGPTIAQVVDAVADPVEDRLVLARVERERDEALRRYRADRDGEALTVAMARLDAEEAKARRPLPSSMSANEVVGYLRDLPTLWADAPASRVRIAESLFERIDVLGFQRAGIHLSGDAIGRGLAAALPVSLGPRHGVAPDRRDVDPDGQCWHGLLQASANRRFASGHGVRQAVVGFLWETPATFSMQPHGRWSRCRGSTLHRFHIGDLSLS
jgi:hypothetical protein